MTLMPRNWLEFSTKFKFIFQKTIFFTLSAPYFLSAQNTIWVKAPHTPFDEFEAGIKTLDFSTSYAEYKLKQKRAIAKAFKLKDKILQAQQFYLSGEDKKAIRSFRQITRLAALADWDREDRRIILYSFLRRAQSEEDKNKRKALLFSALDFAFFPINSESYRDYNLFPPPLMEELRLIQEKTPALYVHWESVFPQHEIILINGKKMRKEEKTRLPQSHYRVSAFSSSHQAWTQNLNLSELLSKKIQTKRLSKGYCENLKLALDKEAQNIKILNLSNCPKQTSLKFNDKQKKLTPNHSLDKLESFNNSYPLDILNSENGSFQNKSSPTSSWLIAGAVVVALSIAISLSYSSNDKTTSDYIY